MIKQVIIIGGHIQALGLARQVEKTGCAAILFLEDGYSVARYSNAVSKTVIFGSMDSLGDALLPYRDTETLLFPTSDPYVDYLADNYEKLSGHFILGIPAPETVTLFGEKRNTYRFAEAQGIAHPESWYPDSIEEVRELSERIAYPVVVKPSVMHSFHKMFGKKAFMCKNREELIGRCEDIMRKMPLSGILLQEYLSGGSELLYSYGVFAIDGNPKAWIMANRIRQNPMDFGNSTTFAVTCDIPEIEAQARKILSVTHYSGLAEVEFMYDSDDETYKFLEINTRAWKWHSISMGLGYGFLSEMIHYYNGEKGDFVAGYKEMAWVERLTDIVVSVKSIIRRRLEAKNVIRSYVRKKQSAVWSWKDPLPAIMYLLLSPILFVKRH